MEVFFWHSVERDVIPWDDSFCLSICEQEESAGEHRGVKKKKDAGNNKIIGYSQPSVWNEKMPYRAT